MSVRLLVKQAMIPQLKPAVETFVAQHGLAIEVRYAAGLHDRYLFVDEQTCHQSGASFKDGAKRAPTTLTQIVDAFSEVYASYQDKWRSATPA